MDATSRGAGKHRVSVDGPVFSGGEKLYGYALVAWVRSFYGP